jgi:ectoine hydroxylase-related dioxygenase (phytanoyl-CoA dioxygenase family)
LGPSFAIAFMYLDPFGSQNGATQIVPRSHDPLRSEPLLPIITEGHAGDISMIDARLLHGATTNSIGRTRRSLLVTYAAQRLQGELAPSASLRGVRMTNDEVFFKVTP